VLTKKNKISLFARNDIKDHNRNYDPVSSAGMKSRFATMENFSSSKGEGFQTSPKGILHKVTPSQQAQG
jgi:hypothetical protein